MKTPVPTLMLSLIALLSSIDLAMGQSQDEVTRLEVQGVYFERFRSLCGARFEGQSVFPEDPGDDFRDQLLVAKIDSCGAAEIRIPFIVGENHSRTWVLKKTDDGLQLKHDHRHEDGTADDITLYGGTATGPGTHQSQSFPADAYTASLIPEAATNEWILSLSEDGSEITYYLERHKKARFKAILKRVPQAGVDTGQ